MKSAKNNSVYTDKSTGIFLRSFFNSNLSYYLDLDKSELIFFSTDIVWIRWTKISMIFIIYELYLFKKKYTTAWNNIFFLLRNNMKQITRWISSLK